LGCGTKSQKIRSQDKIVDIQICFLINSPCFLNRIKKYKQEVFMAYLGEHMYHCEAVPFDWQYAHLIVVSGTGPNFCGHALISAGLYYFHVDGLNARPWYMNADGYRRYLKDNKKRQLQRKRVQLSNPDGAQRKLEELTAKNWRWFVLPSNCASFVEEILEAGGSKVSNLLNCPVRGGNNVPIHNRRYSSNSDWISFFPFFWRVCRRINLA